MNWWAVAGMLLLPLWFVPGARGKVGRRTAYPHGRRVESCGGIPRRAAQRLSFWLVNTCRKLGVTL